MGTISSFYKSDPGVGAGGCVTFDYTVGSPSPKVIRIESDEGVIWHHDSDIRLIGEKGGTLRAFCRGEKKKGTSSSNKSGESSNSSSSNKASYSNSSGAARESAEAQRLAELARIKKAGDDYVRKSAPYFDAKNSNAAWQATEGKARVAQKASMSSFFKPGTHISGGNGEFAIRLVNTKTDKSQFSSKLKSSISESRKHSEIIAQADEPTVYIPDGSTCDMLIPVDSAALGMSYIYRDLSSGAPALISDNMVFPLVDEITGAYSIPYDGAISDIQWRFGDCFFTSDSLLVYRHPEGKIITLVTADAPISSFGIMDNGVVLATGRLLSFYSFDSMTSEALYYADSPISDISCLGGDISFSAGDSLMALGKDSVEYLFTCSSPIVSLESAPGGCVFVGTEAEVFYYAGPDKKRHPLFNKGAKDITLIGEDLYVVFIDNSSVRITNVLNFI